jgi:hypothetical protein
MLAQLVDVAAMMLRVVLASTGGYGRAVLAIATGIMVIRYLFAQE